MDESGNNAKSSKKVMMTIGSNPKFNIESDSNVVFDEDIEDVPLPPDGGWGWVIVLSSFMCNLILDGDILNKIWKLTWKLKL